MQLEQSIKTALDELRMQMLGAQVLFGFYLQGSFQSAFDELPAAAKNTAAAALCLITMTLGLLIAAPAQHRLIERGYDSQRILDAANLYANLALLPFSLAMGCAFFVIASTHFRQSIALAAGVAASVVALLMWYGLGTCVRIALAAEKPLCR
jgi:hypothetical protein